MTAMDYEGTRNTANETALDSAALAQALPELAAAATAAVRSGGIPLIADANNTVVLPDGVSLDDITVRGRDLIIQTSDGRTYVIVDGAVFVPQIVAQGVAVPPLNLAALLIGNEPEPAAGAIRSSGGNFAVPVGSIQDAYKIGNLLPYTELNFPQPRVREIFPAADRKPITGPNADVQLDDDALAGGNPGGTGDDADGVNTAGTLSASSGDGALTWSLSTSGAPTGFSYVANGTGIDIFQGETKILVVTLNAATGAYNVTQIAPIAHGAGGDENNQAFTLTYAVTDIDGDTASGTLGINVDDDTPVANPDTDTIAAGEFGPATGNILTDASAGDAGDSDNGKDSVGADGGLVLASISGFGGAGTVGGTTQGHYGVLSLDSAGNYTYLRSAGTPGGVTDTFTYSIRDADGDVATSTLTITIADAVPRSGENAVVLLDDDALAGGNPGGTGDDSPDNANLTGTLGGSGGDGALTWALVTSGAPAGFSYVATANGLNVLQGSTLVMTVTLNPSTGTYTVAQIAPIAHPAGGDENNQVFAISYTVTDVDGDPATGTLTINVDDDTPTVAANGEAAALVVDESNFAVNSVQNLSTLFAHSFGADGAAAGGGITYALGVAAGPSGLVDTLSGQTVVLSLNGAVVEGRTTGGLLVFTVAVDAGGNVTLDQSRAVVHIPDLGPDDITSIGANLVTLTQTVTDGDGDSAAASAGIGSLLQFVDDAPSAAADTDALLAGAIGPATGNVLTDAAPGDAGDTDNGKDFPGADGGSVTAVSSNNVPANSDNMQDANGDLLVVGEFGTLTLNVDGSYSYVRNGTGPIDATDSFTYTLTDGDGDTATATLTITVQDAAPITGRNAIVLLDDDARDNGNPGGIGDVDPDTANTAGTLAGSGGDGALTWALTGVGLPAGFTSTVVNAGLVEVRQGTTLVLTVTLDSTTGAYAVSQNAPISHPAGLDENSLGFALSYTVTDADGDSAPGSLTINVNDDTPIAADDTDALLTGATTASGNVLTGAGSDGDPAGADMVGADGPATGGAVTAITGFSGAGSIGGVTQGQFGELTLDADGNYTYTRYSGAPGNSQDVFTYTLTDGDGDTTTATLTILIEDARPITGPNALIQLDDDALGGGNPGGIGDVDPDTANTAGTLAGSGGDGALTWALATTGAPAGFSYVANGTGIDVFQGAVKVVAITLAEGTGAYTVTQLAPIMHASGADENGTVFTLAYSVTDADLDSAAGVLTINVNDDTPIAADDTDALLAGATGPATGNVLTDDAPGDAGDSDNGKDFPGADGGAVAGVASNNVPANSDTAFDTNGDFVVAGEFGTLTLNIDGSYSYVRSGTGPINAQDVFTYTLKDGDGDAATATLKITLQDAAPITGPNALIQLDDDALGGGNPGGIGDVDPDTANTAGTLAGSGGDGALTWALATTGAPAGFSYVANGTGIDVFQGAVKVVAITLAEGTGAYTVTQLAPIMHASGADENGTVFTLAYSVTDADLDSAAGVLTINVNDDTPAPTATGVIPTLTVDETALGTNDTADFSTVFTPHFGADGAAVGGGIAYALSVVSGPSGLIDTLSGQAVTLSLVGGVVEGRTASNDLVFQVSVNSTGAVTLDQLRAVYHDPNTGPNDVETLAADLISLTQTVTDRDGDSVPATIGIGDHLQFVDDAPSAGSNLTVFLNDDALANGNPGGDGDTGAVQFTAGTLSHTYGNDGGTLAFLTTGAPAGFQYVAAGSNILVQQNQGGSFVTVATVTLNAVSGAYTVTQNAPVLHPTIGTIEENLSFTLNYVVTDGDLDKAPGQLLIVVNDDTPLAFDDTDTVTEDGPSVADGNVFTGSGGSDLNATDGVKDSIGADGEPLTGPVTGIAFGATSGTVGVSLAGTYGSLILGSDGQYTYTLDNTKAAVQALDTGEFLTEIFTYQITDRDGDKTTATLTIRIDGTNDAPSVNPGTTAVSEEGLPLGNPDDVGNTDTTNSTVGTGVIIATDVDGDTLFYTLGTPTPGLTSGGVAVVWTGSGTGSLTGTAGGIPVITVTIDGSGNYTVTLLGHIDHPNNAVEDSLALTVPVNVSDGTVSSPTTITVSIEDDSPIATTGTTSGSVDEDGGLSGGIAGGTGDIAATTVATGSVVGLFSGGADTAPQYLLTTTTGLPALSSGGVAITYAIAGNVLTATAGASPVFTLSLNSSTGGWTFTLLGPIDHAQGLDENNLVLSFTGIVQAVDADGDRASATGTFSVTINDDTPSAHDDSAIQGLENAPVTINVFTNDERGADGTLATSVALVPGSLHNGLGAASGTLINNGNGTFTYTPGAGETGTITFQYTITDRDGDPSMATATITLLADSVPNPPAVGAAVDDDGLASSNPASGTGDIDANSGDLDGPLSSEASFRGQINVNFGNDTGTVSFANLNGTLGTIGTETVNYSWNTLTNTLTATGPRGVLFTVSLTPSGAYTVTLVDNVLHTAGGNETSTSTLLNYLSTDSDGDSTTSGQMVIVFNDDMPAPTASTTQPQLTVDETILATNATASFASVFTANFGADGAAIGGGTAYTLGLNAGASGLTDTLSGQAVNLVMNGGVVEGRTAGSNLLVFTVSVNGSGDVTLDQLRAIVHSPNTGPNQAITLAADNLITLTGTFTDGDGDAATATANIGQNLTFLDDAPMLGTVQNQQTDNNPATAPAVGTLHFTPGADGAGSTMTITANVTGLTSGGHALVTNQVGSVLTAYADNDNSGTFNAGDTAVFTLSVSPNAGTSGQYTFDLITALDPTVTNVSILSNGAFGSGPSNGIEVTNSATAEKLTLVTGWAATGGFTGGEEGAWLAGGTPDMTQRTDVNGSTSGWGLANNNFDAGEFIRFDFGALNDYDGPGGYTPPVAGPYANVSYASFSFFNFGGGDKIEFVAHYTNGTTQNWVLDGATAASTLTVNSPAGTQIAWIDVYEATGSIKLNLTDIGVTSTTIDKTLPFTVTLTDGDGDPTSTGSFSVHVATGLTPLAPAAPIAIDLNGDGIHYLAADAGVSFDYDGSGTKVGTAWVDAHDGLLAIDANGSGSVDNGREIVFGGNGLTDLQGVAAIYDSNHDGMLDAQDASFAQFGVWQDSNSNGVSEAGEFKTLTELGIVSLNLTSDGQGATAANGDVTIFGTTTYIRVDGTSGNAADVAFATTSLQRQAQPAELAAMNAAATGLLAAMALDHANAAADTGLRTAAAHTADLPAVTAIAAIDVSDSAPQSASVQLAALASGKIAAMADTHGSADRGDAGLGHASQDKPADHGSDGANLAADSGKSALFAAHDAGQSAMDALLTVAAPAAVKGEMAAPAVAEAMADAAGNHAVDHLVDHFAAGAATGTEASHKAGDFALQGLLDSSVQGSGHDAGAPHLSLMQVLDHEQAAALA